MADRMRRGMWVRLKGWQMHWPQENAKIESIDKATCVATLDRPILRERKWHIGHLSKSF